MDSMLSIINRVRKKLTPARYWTDHNVTLHREFASSQESLDYFHWRNAQYFGYIDLMPVSGQDGKAVLDYGCGPGNDLVGFGVYSKPSRLIGADVSPTSIAEAEHRVAVHGIQAELLRIDETTGAIPLPDDSIDHIHCSGVLHHVPDPEQTLRECRRVLKARGGMRVMIYNYPSLWLHLYVAYVKQIAEQAYAHLDARGAFALTTDGPECPIARVYKPAEFIALAESCGFECAFLGAAISMWEMTMFPRRFEAIMNPALGSEHRDFLMSLALDQRGYPMYEGHYVGVDGCYTLRPRP